MTHEPGRQREDPAAVLAAKLGRYARGLTAEDRRVLQAMLVMAMDPLDRQARRSKPVLTADETRKVAELLRER